MSLPALLLAAPLAAAAPQGPPQLVVLPDTQYYCEQPALRPTFVAQTQWVASRLVTDRIAFVSHVGDIVQSGAQVPAQWNAAELAMSVLDGGAGSPVDGLVPYAAALGNHDLEVVSDKGSGAATYLTRFGPGRYAGRSWYLGASASGHDHAQRFETAEGPWLHLCLEWRPHDDALAFAHRTIAAHPGVPVIVTTHEHLGPGLVAPHRTGGATPDGSGDNDALQVFRKLLEPNPEVVLVLCGHVGGAGKRSDPTVMGRVVHQVLEDFQFDPNGGNGWMMRVELDADAALLRFRTFSPVYVPGVTDGPDRSLEPTANFDLPFDERALRGRLDSRSILRFRAGEALGGVPPATVLDTTLRQAAPGTAFGDDEDVACDLPGVQGLLAFPGLVGTAPHQVRPGAVVERAVLTLTTEGSSAASGTGAAVHRMLRPWDEASTWDSLGGGVDLGTEAAPAPDLLLTAEIAAKGTRSFDVTAAVQAWADGAPNHGWLLRALGDDAWIVRSSGWEAAMERPLLTVELAPPCAAPLTYCPAAPNSLGVQVELAVSVPPSPGPLALHATGLPQGSAAVFLAGTARADLPLANGRLCVGGQLVRLPGVFLPDAFATVQTSADPAGPPLAGLGATLRFQCWYRDGAPLGANLSSAVEVLLCP